MAEWIMKEEKDMDGVYCYIKKGEVVRCKDCIKKPLCMIYRDTNDDFGYCSLAESPVTCDYCKYWNGLMRDGHYWCYKHSTYMDGCEEGERNDSHE